ncbi:MAG: hypothetical protein PHF31_02730 [Methylobacter sp.]|nr:hypothetical protein [Methylobacter sp.]
MANIKLIDESEAVESVVTIYDDIKNLWHGFHSGHVQGYGQ